MLIFTQDKKNIIEAKLLQMQRNLGGGKDGKFIILASSVGIGATIAATFSDEKTALDALEKVYKAFAEGAVSYEF